MTPLIFFSAGFLTSYMAPATISMASQNMPSQNDTTSQSQMASQGHMSSKNPMASRSPMASQSPVAPQTPMASQSPVASQSYMASQNIMASQSQSHMASQNIMASQSNMASQGHMASQIQNNIQCNCIGRHTACLQSMEHTCFKELYSCWPFCMSFCPPFLLSPSVLLTSLPFFVRLPSLPTYLTSPPLSLPFSPSLSILLSWKSIKFFPFCSLAYHSLTTTCKRGQRK